MAVRRMQGFELEWDDLEAHRELGEVADRLGGQHDQAAWGHVLTTLEEGEAAHFARMKGRYIRTGATFASLTQPIAPGAIRRRHGGEQGVTFGTSIYYARFLTKSPFDVADDQVTKRRGKGKSAVLNLTPKTRRTIAEQMLAHMVAPANDQPGGLHGGWAPGLKVKAARR